MTLQQRHDGEDAAILTRQDGVYAKAKAGHPDRWAGEVRNWSPVQQVVLNPAPIADESATEVA